MNGGFGRVLLGAGLVLLAVAAPQATAGLVGPGLAQPAGVVAAETGLAALAAQYSPAALTWEAARRGVPQGNLKVLATTRVTVPGRPGPVVAMKIADAQAKEVNGVLVDPATLEVWEDNGATATPAPPPGVASRVGAVGKKDAQLLSALATADPGDRVQVLVWLRGPDVTALAADIAQQKGITYQANQFVASPEVRGQARAELKTAYETGCRSAGRAGMALVARLGGRAFGPLSSAPLILAEMRADQIAALEQRPEVCSLGLNGQVQPQLKSAIQTVYPNKFYKEYKFGGGVTVAVVDAERIDFSNKWLRLRNGGSYGGNYPGSHATGVAGCIASSRLGGKGIAPKVTLLSADAYSFDYWDLIYASDWALSSGAEVLNLSFGGQPSDGIDSFAAYYDHVAGEAPYYAVVVAAAGNYMDPYYSYLINTPALGYNVLAVGALDDNDTVGTISATTNTIWYDDAMAWWSAYQEPSWMGDRNKPEVAAPGVSITMPAVGITGLQIGDGTSFATPIVSGLAALEINKDRDLIGWSEVTRAIIMATAQHRTSWSNKSSAYVGSDDEGVGTIIASRADMLMRKGWYGASLFYPGEAQQFTMYIPAGRIVRWASCWVSHTTDYGGVYGADTLYTDLDVLVADPYGNPIAGSASYGNSYEVTEFQAPSTGTYTFVVTPFRMDVSAEWMGWAVYTSKPSAKW